MIGNCVYPGGPPAPQHQSGESFFSPHKRQKTENESGSKPELIRANLTTASSSACKDSPSGEFIFTSASKSSSSRRSNTKNKEIKV